jgi:DNA-binding NtrC family response regulator
VATEKKSVLIVDDESVVRESLEMILGRTYHVAVAEDASRALDLLQKQTSCENSKIKFPDLVLLDVMMPGVDGMDLLAQINQKFPKLPVVMLTASTTVKTAVEAMKIGAVDYLNKPYDVDELLSLIEEVFAKGSKGRSEPTKIITTRQRRGELPDLSGDYGSIIGEHPLMRDLYRRVGAVAGKDTTILITGESGTGKEVFAREIHKRSARAEEKFVALNCAAIPESLIESELFGHEKGAFTHAVEKRIGHFELANGGTLFLDEIGELSLAVQVKMLRFLQSQEFYRVGHSKPINVNVRVIAATNRNLQEAIEQGRFRQDLFYRINVVSFELPPLREKKSDIPSLVNSFIQKLSPLYGGKTPAFTEAALELLCNYEWPGNVRELENVVESMLALTTGLTIGIEDLPSRIKNASKQGIIGAESGAMLEEVGRTLEREMILHALNSNNYVQTRAAETLGITRRILKYKMDKLGIKSERA